MPELLQDWLKSLKLPPAKLKSLETVLADPEVSAAAKDAFMARADYSRNMDALKKEQADAQKKIADQEAKNAKYYADLGTWKGDADKKYADGQKALEAANNKLAQITNKMGTLKNQYSIEDADLADILNPAITAPVVTAPVVDPNKDSYLSRDAYNKDVDEFRTQFPLIPAVIADLDDRHRELFGKPLPGKTQLVQEAMAAKKPLDAYAAEKFGFAAREKEIEKENWQKEADVKFKEREEAIRSEYANPAARPLGDNPASPVLGRSMGRGVDDAGKPVALDPQRGVKAAIAGYKGTGAA